jgi:hypothetical protein
MFTDYRILFGLLSFAFYGLNAAHIETAAAENYASVTRSVPVRFVTQTGDLMVTVNPQYVSTLLHNGNLLSGLNDPKNHALGVNLLNVANSITTFLGGQQQSMQVPFHALIGSVSSDRELGEFRRLMAAIFVMPAAWITLTVKSSGTVLVDGSKFSDYFPNDENLVIEVSGVKQPVLLAPSAAAGSGAH